MLHAINLVANCVILHINMPTAWRYRKEKQPVTTNDFETVQTPERDNAMVI